MRLWTMRTFSAGSAISGDVWWMQMNRFDVFLVNLLPVPGCFRMFLFHFGQKKKTRNKTWKENNHMNYSRSIQNTAVCIVLGIWGTETWKKKTKYLFWIWTNWLFISSLGTFALRFNRCLYVLVRACVCVNPFATQLSVNFSDVNSMAMPFSMSLHVQVINLYYKFLMFPKSAEIKCARLNLHRRTSIGKYLHYLFMQYFS